MITEQKCLIWGTDATVKSEDYDFHFHINSVRAGGKYQIKEPSKRILCHILESNTNQAELFKLVLSNWILEQNQFGNIPVITEDILEAAQTWKNLSIFERADKCLFWLHDKTNHLGATTLLYPQEDLNEDQDLIPNLLCWTASLNLEEAINLLGYCHEQKWLKLTPKKKRIAGGTHIHSNRDMSVGQDSFQPYYEIKLRPEGFAKIEELTRTANPNSAQAFVARWFAPEMKEPYDNGIMRAIQDCGYKSVDIGEKDHINKICDEIIAEIRRSKFIVVDLTARTVEHEEEKIHEARGGVYYEAGFAQGLNIPVIWTCRRDALPYVHFDIRQYNTIVWKDSSDLYTQLKQRIGAVIGEFTSTS